MILTLTMLRRIIPFVAADAVLHQNEEDPLYAESNLKTSQFPDILKPTAAVFEAPASNFFSPPVETEGNRVFPCRLDKVILKLL